MNAPSTDRFTKLEESRLSPEPRQYRTAVTCGIGSLVADGSPRWSCAFEIELSRRRAVAAKAQRHRSSDSSRPAKGIRSGFRRKSCSLCKDHAREVDYKDVALLRRYLSERGKIRSRDKSGACRRHQRLVAIAIKRAREMALLPYVVANDGSPERKRTSR